MDLYEIFKVNKNEWYNNEINSKNKQLNKQQNIYGQDGNYKSNYPAYPVMTDYVYWVLYTDQKTNTDKCYLTLIETGAQSTL